MKKIKFLLLAIVLLIIPVFANAHAEGKLYKEDSFDNFEEINGSYYYTGGKCYMRTYSLGSNFAYLKKTINDPNGYKVELVFDDDDLELIKSEIESIERANDKMTIGFYAGSASYGKDISNMSMHIEGDNPNELFYKEFNDENITENAAEALTGHTLLDVDDINTYLESINSKEGLCFGATLRIDIPLEASISGLDNYILYFDMDEINVFENELIDSDTYKQELYGCNYTVNEKTIKIGKNFATLEKHVEAPSGNYVNIKSKENDYIFVVDEMKKIPVLEDSANFTLEKTINGQKLTDQSFSTEAGDFYERVKFLLKDRTLIEAKTNVTPSTISARLIIIVDDSENKIQYKLVFEFNEITIEPLAVDSVIKIECSFFISPDEGDVRYRIVPEINRDIFDENYGLPTDGRIINGSYDPTKDEKEGYADSYHLKYWDEFDVYLYLNDSIELQHEYIYDGLYSCKGLEIQGLPTKTMRYKAVLEFYSGGVKYRYESNEIVLEKLDYKFLIDGYDNRLDIGINTEHKIKFVTSIDNLENYTYYYSWSNANHTFNPEKDDVEEQTISFTPTAYDDNNLNIAAIFHDKTGLVEYVFYSVNFKFNVVEKQPEYISPDEALTISYEKYPYEVEDISKLTKEDYLVDLRDENIMLLEGESVSYIANLDDEVLGTDTVVTYKWEASIDNIVKLSTDNNKLIITPDSVGVVTIRLTVYADTFGSVYKEFKIRVVSYNYAETKKIGLNNNDKLSLCLNIDGYYKFINAKVNWSILDNGQEIPYSINNDASISISKECKKCLIKANILDFDAIEYELEAVEGIIILDGIIDNYEIGKNAYHDFSYRDNSFENVVYESVNWYIDGLCFSYGGSTDISEDVALRFVDNNPFKVKVLFRKEGNHVVTCEAKLIDSNELVLRKITNEAILNLSVLNSEPEKEDYAKYIDVSLDGFQYNYTGNGGIIDFENENALLLEGGNLDLIATIDKKVLGEAKETYLWSIDYEDIIGFDPMGNTLAIKPLKAGVVNITITISADTIGVVSKTFTVKVINYKTAEKEIFIEDLDGFHKAGSDVKAQLMVDGCTNILNAKVNWGVFANGDEPEEVSFSRNSDGSITLSNFEEGKYTINADVTNSSDQLQCEVKFAKVDYNAVTRKWLPIIAGIMLIFAACLVAFKAFFNKKHLIDVNIEEAINKINALDIESEDYTKGLKKACNMLKFALNKANDYNIKNQGQYQQVIDNLKDSIQALRNIINDKSITNEDKANLVNDAMNKHILKAYNLAKDIERALESTELNHKNANKGAATINKENTK